MFEADPVLIHTKTAVNHDKSGAIRAAQGVIAVSKGYYPKFLNPISSVRPGLFGPSDSRGRGLPLIGRAV